MESEEGEEPTQLVPHPPRNRIYAYGYAPTKTERKKAMKNQNTVPVRISGELLEKLYFVAESEGRTLNNQFLLMARNSVAYFEKTKGKIKPDALRAVREKLAAEYPDEE